MRANGILGLIFALMLGLALPVVAEEMAEEAVAEAEVSVEEFAPAEVPAVEEEGVLQGSITAVDLTSENPSVTVKSADGTVTKVDLDLDLSLALKGDEEMALEELAAGQNVKITQADFDGKLVIDTIEIV